MRAVLLSFVCAVFLAAGAAPQDKTTPAEESPNAIPGFDLNALDKSADPCENFYQYACGTWIKDHPVPADRGR
jgi:putative endopeptidase